MKISFDPEAWIARTAGFPRLVSSILFDISLHNWRTGTSMSLAHYGIITSDLPQEQANGIADMLCAAGAIQQDEHGIWSVAAIEEWTAANVLREKRAQGGRNGAVTKKAEVEASKPRPPKIVAVAPAEPSAAGPAPAPPNDDDARAVEKIKAAEEAANVARATLAQNIVRLAEAWNTMALKNGLPEIKMVNDKRKEQAGARIREHGIAALLKAVEAIPQSDLLMGRVGRAGWKASFDFILQPSSCLKLIEGTYHQQGDGQQSGWRS